MLKQVLSCAILTKNKMYTFRPSGVYVLILNEVDSSLTLFERTVKYTTMVPQFVCML